MDCSSIMDCTSCLKVDWQSISPENDISLNLSVLLNHGNIPPIGEISIVENMVVKETQKDAFETALKSILRQYRKVPGHISTCVVRPRAGDLNYCILVCILSCILLYMEMEWKY